MTSPQTASRRRPAAPGRRLPASRATVRLAFAALLAAASAGAAAAQAPAGRVLAADTPQARPEAAPADPAGMVELGIRYEHAEGRERDYARAHELYCTAARQDDTNGLLRLGWMYANGRGVPRDDGIANSLFRQAAAQGSELAARLATTIRGDGERLPECMAQAAPQDTGPTPVVDDPARFRTGPASADARALVATVVRMAREYKLDPRLVFALIRVESGFDPLARSPKNAQGLMQLIPDTAERFGVSDPWNPVQNLRGGMSYLRWLLSYFQGDVVLTLAAYNAGEGAVDRYRGVPPYPETLAYVQRIRAFYPFDRHAFEPRIAADRAPAWARLARADQ